MFWGAGLKSENLQVASKGPLGAEEETSLGAPRAVKKESAKKHDPAECGDRKRVGGSGGGSP